MKKMNRREFLTLTGAAVVALSLAGCGGPSAPPAPAAPTQKELDLLKALNEMLVDYWNVQGHPEMIRTLSYSQDASDFARHFVSPCVKADKAEVEMTPEQDAAFENEMLERRKALQKYQCVSAVEGLGRNKDVPLIHNSAAPVRKFCLGNLRTAAP